MEAVEAGGGVGKEPLDSSALGLPGCLLKGETQHLLCDVPGGALLLDVLLDVSSCGSEQASGHV